MKLVVICVSILLLQSCYFSLEATITQNPGNTVRRAHRVSHYSTSDGSVELVGTITETFIELTTKNDGAKTCVNRVFKGDNSRHYHKHSLPQELAFRVPIQYCIENAHVISINGFENYFTQTVDKLPVPKRFREQLHVAEHPEQFETLLRNYYYISHMFEGTFPVLTNVTEQLMAKIAQSPFPIDSVVTGDLEKQLGLKSMPFSIYYRVKPQYNHLMLEQLVASSKGPEGFSESGQRFKESSFVSAEGSGVYTVWIDVDTGDVLKEVDNQNHINVVKNKVSNEELDFKSIQYTEVLYETVH